MAGLAEDVNTVPLPQIDPDQGESWVQLLPAGKFDLNDQRGPWIVKDMASVIERSRRDLERGMPVDMDHALDRRNQAEHRRPRCWNVAGSGAATNGWQSVPNSGSTRRRSATANEARGSGELTRILSPAAAVPPPLGVQHSQSRRSIMSNIPDHLSQALAELRASHTAQDRAIAVLEAVLQACHQQGVNALHEAAAPINEHRREHRPGRAPKIASDPELQAFIAARIDRLTYQQIADEIAENFPPERHVHRATVHRWAQQSSKSATSRDHIR
ncbi:helix-turn-helix domain-containing protein [Pseudodonghicola xiamenensis]|uniref:Uncharacterized protein n=1 Tax=Pseudodonghicola xiamenensis TaxID=337702 RepID=A0A8J3HCL7_9RHOB|nr:helix-turn-helix domain-containing protein [Pseudodonghicola xiamenensis]GHH04069.1 hypothetical protein GCM10010961_42300 [Pseudodonghicola xiamenensis]